jgi:hypothetical protein
MGGGIGAKLADTLNLLNPPETSSSSTSSSSSPTIWGSVAWGSGGCHGLAASVAAIQAFLSAILISYSFCFDSDPVRKTIY